MTKLQGSSAWTQYCVLCYKNYLLAIRNWKGTIGQLLTPVAVVLMLAFFQQVSNEVLGNTTEFPAAQVVGPVPRCQPGNAGTCTTIMYAPQEPFVDSLMQRLAQMNGLSPHDVAPVPGVSNLHNSPCPNVTACLDLFAADNVTVTQFMLNNPNMTQNLLHFTSAYYPAGILPNVTAYILYYNITIDRYPIFGDDHTLQLKRALDEAELSLHSQRPTSVQLAWKPFPTPEPRIHGFDVVATYGGEWFYLPPMITFFVLLTELVTEKEAKLRVGMRMMGMRTSMFWASWFTYGLVFNVLSTLIMIASGWIAGFAFFTNSAFSVLFIMFLSFSVAMTCVAIMLSSFIEQSKTAQTVGYSIVLMGFVFQTILCSAYGELLDLLFADTVATWVKAVRWILTFYPPFYFSKAYYDVSALSSATISFAEGKIINGPGFHWSDLFDVRIVNFFNFVINVPLTIYAIGFLMLNCVVYLGVGLYLDAILPGMHGTPRHPLFIFGLNRWPCARAALPQRASEDSPQSSDVGVVAEAQAAADAAQNATAGVAVCVHKLRKEYGTGWWTCGAKSASTITAVDNLSLTVRDGEILALLGHNGAGKTTTISILTGLLTATSGHASVYGIDVGTDVRELQKCMGVCPQHDILFDRLTAAEHLRLFARLKGVGNRAAEEAEVTRLLKEVDLTSVRDVQAGTFSGGMKRRLSVAISAIGDPKVIYLDEPTTGMDPVNRRGAWQLIQRLKAGRAIILTTHSMEEADALGDRIGVMAHGKLATVGNSLELKQRFGKGYRLEMVIAPHHSHNVLQSIQQQVPDAIVAARDANNVCMTIPFTAMDGLLNVVNYLENDESHQVSEWGVSYPTMEEVFLHVTTQAQFEMALTAPEDEGDADSDTEAAATKGGVDTDDANQHLLHDAAAPSQGTPKSFPYRALLRKNLVLQTRAKAQCLCQVLTPLVVIGLLVLLQHVITTELGTSSLTIAPSFVLPLNVNLMATNLFPAHHAHHAGVSPLALNSSIAAMMLSAAGAGRGSGLMSRFGLRLVPLASPFAADVSEQLPTQQLFTAWSMPALSQTPPEPQTFMDDDDFDDDDLISNVNSAHDCLEFFLVAVESNSPAVAQTVGHLNQTGYGSGVLGEMRTKHCRLRNGTHVRVPYFLPRQSAMDIDSELFADLNMLNNASLNVLGNAPPCAATYLCPAYLTPDGSLVFRDLTVSSTHVRLDYTLQVNDYDIIAYHRPNNFTRLGLPHIPDWLKSQQLLVSPARLALTEMVQQATMKYGGFAPAVPELLAPVTLKSVANMPVMAAMDYSAIVEVFGSFLYPLAMTLQLPLFVFVLVLEKETRLREMQKSMGMKMSAYILSNYGLNLVIYIAVVVLFWVSGWILEFRFFTQTNAVLLAVFFFGWGISLVSMSFLVASFLSSRRVATVMGYIIALFGNLIALLFCDAVYGDIPPFSLGATLPSYFLLFPVFGLVRGIYLMNFACVAANACVTSWSQVGPGTELANILVSLYVAAAVYMLLALYIDEVWPHEFGVRRHPLFFLRPLWNLVRPSDRRAPTRSAADMRQPLLNTSSVEMEALDPDVAAEGVTVDNIWDSDPRAAARFPVLISHLRKQFGAKVAVKDMNLSIARGECFGLLGENGAGKTTTINMLTGVFPPTSGDARLGGFSILDDMDAVHLVLGVCPQHDVLWESLSCEEHVLYYARLKGVDPKHEQEHVKAALTEVGLWSVRTRLAGRLSGGMKRRLSVAVSLSGNSQIVLLDEPTTGLDPASRRRVWRILNRARTGRAVILTTHSMDEAETLCTRIGIVTHGVLRCLGNQQHLKNRFGGGYRLYINFRPEAQTSAIRLVLDMFRNARIDSEFRGYATFLLQATAADGSCSVSQVFQAMHQHSKSAGITDWGVGQVTLEDVFHRIVGSDHHTAPSKDDDLSHPHAA